MILTCPACGTRYSIPDAAFGGAPRQVECVRCHHQWLEYPIAAPIIPPAASPLPPVPPALPPLPTATLTADDPLTPAPRNRRWPWVLLLGLACGLSGATWWVINHNHWPTWLNQGKTSATTPTTMHFSLGPVTKEVIQNGETTTLVLRGELNNNSAAPHAAPRLNVYLFDAQGHEVDAWPATFSQPTLPPHSRIAWVVRFYNPPLAQISRFEARLGE